MANSDVYDGLRLRSPLSQNCSANMGGDRFIRRSPNISKYNSKSI
ncbi:hypothetical protein [Nostoc sp.]